MKWLIILAVLTGLKLSVKSQVLINEISNANVTHYINNEGQTYDWIELYNGTQNDVDLTGYFLSDKLSQLEMWPVKNTIIGANDFLLIHASGKDTGLHASFRIQREGEIIYLSKDGELIDSLNPGMLKDDHSRGRCSDGGVELALKADPTPGYSNDQAVCYKEYEPEPEFSLESGFYSGKQAVSLTTSSGTGEIRYTLSGKFPGPQDQLYTGPIVVDTTTIITARTFSKGNNLPGRVAKHSYFIDETQLELPVISISLDPHDLWDWEEGMYVLGPDAEEKFPHYGANFWKDWEKRTHIEYFDAEKNKLFGHEFGLKIRGGHSRAYDQRSFMVKARSRYGKGQIEHVFIPENSHIDKYNNLILRNGGQDYRFVRFRDAFANRIVKNTHIDIMAYEPAIVFLNGAYWGHYGMRDKQDGDYVEYNHGYPADQVDVLKHTPHEKLYAEQGSIEHFYTMYDFITSSAPADSAFFDKSSKLLDLENFADYFIAEIHYGNDDWIDHTPSCNNIKLWRPQTVSGRWRYMMYDLDKGLGGRGRSPETNNLNMVHQPDGSNVHSDIFGALLKNTRFRHYFINRYADLLNTVFQPHHMRKVAYQMRDEIKPSMERHFTRWSGNYNKWLNEVDLMLKFNEERIPLVRQHIEQEFSLNKQVSVTLDVLPKGAGRIHISTIIPDSLPWTGVYYDGVPVSITAIPNPGYEFQHWSSGFVLEGNKEQNTIAVNVDVNDKFVAHFSGQTAQPEITFSEINYHPDKAFDGGDWVELHNYGASPIDLSHWVFRNGNDLSAFKIPFGTVIMPGQYLVLAEHTLKFSSLYPKVGNYTGGFRIGLKNSGDMLRLFDHQNKVILSMTYSDSKPWPKQADGKGQTLELKEPGADLNQYTSWFTGCYGGSPGTAFTHDCQIVSVGESPEVFNMRVFPNPSDGRFLVNITGTNQSGGEWQYQLYGISGRMIKSRNYLSGNTFEIDLGTVNPGIYYLRFRDKKGRVTGKKIMIK